MQEIFADAAVSVTLAAMTLLMGYATSALRKLRKKAEAETEQIKSTEQRKLLLDALDDVERLALKTVTQIEQTTAKTLREDVRDGIEEPEELLKLAHEAYAEVEASLKPEVKALIDDNFGSFQRYLTKTIEQKVYELKTSREGY